MAAMDNLEAYTRGLTEEDLRRVAAHARDSSLATCVTLVLGLAAQTHPEEIQRALASVFDLRAVEDQANRIMLVVAAAQQKAAAAHELFLALQADLDVIERRLDALNLALETLERKSP